MISALKKSRQLLRLFDLIIFTHRLLPQITETKKKKKPLERKVILRLENKHERQIVNWDSKRQK